MMLVVVALVAVVLFGVGRWGSGRVEELVPADDSDEETRAKKIRVMRRGVITAQVTGVVLFVLAAFIAIRIVTH
jgi:hypothetical protein